MLDINQSTLQAMERFYAPSQMVAIQWPKIFIGGYFFGEENMDEGQLPATAVIVANEKIKLLQDRDGFEMLGS